MATTPKKPQDHLTAKHEAVREDLRIKFGEDEYVIPSDTMDNVEILEFIEDELYIRAIKAIVGQAQWVAFKDANRDANGKVTTEVFQQFLETVFESLGN